MNKILKIILFNLAVALLIIFYMHVKKFKQVSNEQVILQMEDFNKKNLEEIIISKNPIVIRTYTNLNNIITTDLIKNSKTQIKYDNNKFISIDKAIDDFSIINQYTSFNKLYLDKKYNEITDLASPLSFFKNNFINLGKKDIVTKITSVTYDRTYIHLLDGELKVYLFHPKNIPKLYLKKKNRILTSNISVKNPDYKKYPKYKNTEYMEIILRKGNVIQIPNKWSFYIEHIDDSIFGFYTSDTIVSKVVSLFS